MSEALRYAHFMDGYSVTEAASVLGVPIERVWELLARGVLAGVPEGETGMRVFLQPRPAPATPEQPAPEPNGSAREAGQELSPFRELLTEFRNLTERYGQALLALGESRGEVASLRSRVDLLEARMDLRLPGGPPAGTWSGAPVAGERTVNPGQPAADIPAGADEHRARTRGPRRATESFAEALARANDPTDAELPPADEVAPGAEAVAAPPDEAELVGEMPVAELVPVAEEAAPVAPDVDEPQPSAVEVADEGEAPEDRTEREATDATEEAEEAAEAAEVPEVAPLATTYEEATGPEAAKEPEAATEPEAPPDEAPVSVEAVEPGAPAAVEPPRLPGASPEVAPPSAMEPEPIEWDADHYSATIDDPDWIEAEAEDASQPADEPVAAAEPEPVAEEPVAADQPEPVADAPVAAAEPEPVADAPVAAAEPEPVAEEPVAADQPEPVADEPTPPPTETIAPAEPAVEEDEPIEEELLVFPGAPELDEAINRLRASAREASGEMEPPSSSAAEAASGAVAGGSALPESALRYRPVPPPAGTAGRAYRRLRRIFPG